MRQRGREDMRCAEHDHSFGDCTHEQREHLRLVRAFNRDLAAAADAGRDRTQVTAAPDPDPLRYMWVDEGGPRVPPLLEEARRLLDAAPVLGGHRRVPGRPVAAGGWAARPSASVGPDGTTLLAWIDREDGAGEQVGVALRDRAGGEIRPAEPSPVTAGTASSPPRCSTVTGGRGSCPPATPPDTSACGRGAGSPSAGPTQSS
jgi:hypothetical protein